MQCRSASEIGGTRRPPTLSPRVLPVIRSGADNGASSRTRRRSRAARSGKVKPTRSPSILQTDCADTTIPFEAIQPCVLLVDDNVGFGSLKNVRRNFQKHIGEPPGDFRDDKGRR